MTLCFLGEITKAAADRFAASIAREIQATAEGSLASSGALVFPPRGPARVLAAGFTEGPTAQGLGRIADAAASLAPGVEAGSLAPDVKRPRRFSPHVTFARLRRPWTDASVDLYRRRLETWRPPAYAVRSCVFFRSRLDPAGAVHTPLATWSLAPATAQVTG